MNKILIIICMIFSALYVFVAYMAQNQEGNTIDYIVAELRQDVYDENSDLSFEKGDVVKLINTSKRSIVMNDRWTVIKDINNPFFNNMSYDIDNSFLTNLTILTKKYVKEFQ